MRSAIYVFWVGMFLLFAFGIYSWNTKKEILSTPPVFSEGARVLYFCVKNKFGFSSVYKLEGGKRRTLVAIHSGRVSNLFLNNQYLYYDCRKDFDSSLWKLDSAIDKKTRLYNFSDVFFTFGFFLNNETIVLSYSPWKDTKTFFVGYTSGTSRLAALNLKDFLLVDIYKNEFELAYPRQVFGTNDVLFKNYFNSDSPYEFRLYNLKTQEERYLPIEVHVDRWCYDDKANRIYFQGAGFIWEYDMASERLKKLFEFKEKIDFLVKHPVEMKFLVKFSNNSKTMFYVDERGVVSEFFSI